MSTATALKLGARVLVPWGLDEPRGGIVVEIWGDASAPSHLRVQLESTGPEDDEAEILLVNPSMVTPAA